MKPFLSLLGLLLSVDSFGALDPQAVPWLESLKKAKVFFFHVCGSADILPNQKSLRRDFAFGESTQGFFFTETPGTSEYWATLQSENTSDAKKHLQSRFEKSHLWRHSKNGLTDLGAPTKMEFPFAFSIKDCVEGSKNSMGMDCKDTDTQRICCSEKFLGPIVYWGSKQEYVLKYSPDPSVKLKVPGESKNRYCNFQQIIEIKGSGR